MKSLQHLHIALTLMVAATASAAGAAVLECPPSTGGAGLSVTVQFVINAEGDAVVGTQNDLAWDDSLLDLAAPGTTSPNCAIDPAIGPGTEPDKRLARSFLSGPGAARTIVLSQVNVIPIPDGPIFSCTFQIAPDAPRETFIIGTSNFIASDGGGQRLPSTSSDCQVTITDPPPTPTPPGHCEDDDDCPEGQICIDNSCATPTPPPPDFCRDDRDCPPEEECVDQRCRPRPTATRTPTPTPDGFCRDARDCPAGELCVDDFCATPTPEGFCRNDEDCPEGQQCIDNRCATPTPPGFCLNDDDCADGEICQDNECRKRGGGSSGCSCRIDQGAPLWGLTNLLVVLIPVVVLLAQRRRAR
jgi:Cys-rich repeat protein